MKKHIKEEIRPGHEHLGTGHSDNLEPLAALDLSKVKSINDLVVQMKGTSFAGRKVGEVADVLETMVKDTGCFKVLTLSGAMTVAKQGLVICDMIDNGMVDCIVSTGALMAHGFIESAGMEHFKYNENMDDKELYMKGYDRIYDTLELEKNLDDAEIVIRQILREWDPKNIACSYKLNYKLGEYLHKNTPGRGVLKSAYEKNIPVYIPAFTDSEFGLDFATHRRRRMRNGEEPIHYDCFLDLEDYAERVMKSETLGIFTIGGGVPRNWAQQIAPYLDLLKLRISENEGKLIRFKYGARICPEPVHWGGLSGCSYSEGVSWGKFVPEAEGGMFAECFVDATAVWPLIIKAVLERIGKG